MNKRKDKPLSTDNVIPFYLRCSLCLNEAVQEILGLLGASPSIQVGRTEQGIQVWCERHDCIFHIESGEGVTPTPEVGLHAPRSLKRRSAKGTSERRTGKRRDVDDEPNGRPEKKV